MAIKEALIGRKEICQMLRWSNRKFWRFAPEMHDAGIIMYQHVKGRPQPVIVAWPSAIQRWAMTKGLRGEKI